MKNWLVAESGIEVLAIAIVYLLFLRPLLASFLIGFSVGFCFIEESNPPP